MANVKFPKIGDTVTYHYFHRPPETAPAGSMRSYPAKVVGVHDPDEGAQALSLLVELDEEVLASGIVREQTHSRMAGETIESGEWTWE